MPIVDKKITQMPQVNTLEGSEWLTIVDPSEPDLSLQNQKILWSDVAALLTGITLSSGSGTTWDAAGQKLNWEGPLTKQATVDMEGFNIVFRSNDSLSPVLSIKNNGDVVIGRNIVTSTEGSIIWGKNSDDGGGRGIYIGNNVVDSSGDDGNIIIGDSSTSSNNPNLLFGNNLDAQSVKGILMGNNSVITDQGSIVIGSDSNAARACIIIGDFGAAYNTGVVIGTRGSTALGGVTIGNQTVVYQSGSRSSNVGSDGTAGNDGCNLGAGGVVGQRSIGIGSANGKGSNRKNDIVQIGYAVNSARAGNVSFNGSVFQFKSNIDLDGAEVIYALRNTTADSLAIGGNSDTPTMMIGGGDKTLGSYGGVKIGGGDYSLPGASTELDLASTNKALKLNVLSSTGDIVNPEKGHVVYVDGIGTASYDGSQWNSPVVGLSNRITVNQGNVATTLGGTIDSTKEYFLDGQIDIANTSIDLSGGKKLNIKGYDFGTSGLYSSENNYTMITGGNASDIVLSDFYISVTGTNSKVFDITDINGTHAIEIDRVNFNDCTSMGVIDGYRQGLETGTGRFGGTPELTLDGTWLGGYIIETSIVRSLVDGAYSLYKAGVSFSMGSRFKTNQNVDLNSTVSFLDFSASNFVNSSTLQLNQCIVTRNGTFDADDATIIPNITHTSLKSRWKNNTGVKNTFNGGKLTVTSESATVIAATSTFYTIAGTWGSSDLVHFDSPSSGQLRHTGNSPTEYKITADLVIDGTDGDDIAVRIRKWDDSASSFIDFTPRVKEVNSFTGGRDVAFFVIFDNIELNTNDYFYLQVANETSTDNVTVENDSLIFVEER